MVTAVLIFYVDAGSSFSQCSMMKMTQQLTLFTDVKETVWLYQNKKKIYVKL